MNTTDESAMIDRQALAQQVIISSGNILATAGFGRAEIADFFTQAAEQLRSSPKPPRAAGVDADDRLARVATGFSQNAAVHELHNLGMKAQTLIPLGPDAPELRDAFDMAMQAVPLLAEAQQALRTMADEAMLPLAAHRAERDIRAADPGSASAIVCLEDFETLYHGVFDILGAVTEALVERQDRDAFTFLLGHLADNGVILNPQLQATIERGTRALAG